MKINNSYVVVCGTLLTLWGSAFQAGAGFPQPESLLRIDLGPDALLLLGSATLLTRQPTIEQAIRSGSGERRMVGFFGAAILVLLSIAIVSIGSITALRDRTRLVEHSYAARVQFEDLMEQYQNARMAWRGYLIGGIDTDRQEFEAAQTRLPRELKSTQALTVDNPRQQDRLATVSRFMAEDLEVFAAEIDARRAGRFTMADNAAAYSNPARFHIADVNRIAREFRAEESRLLDERESEARASSRTIVPVIAIGNVAGLLILLYAFALLKRQNAERTRLATALQSANQELETKVDARTLELADANHRLEALNATLEQRIAERTAELADLYDNAPCGYHSVDEDGIFRQMNETELRWLGYTRDEVIGKMRHHDLHTPESLERFLYHFPRFKESGWLKDAQYDYVRKDGSVFSVSVNGTAIRDAQGKYVQSRASVYDITERRQMEQRLRVANAFLDSVLNHLPNMVFVKDAKDLRFVSINKAGEELIGVPRDKLIGRNDYDLFSRDEADHFTAKDREVFAANRLLDIPEEKIRSQHRGERILHTQKIPLSDDKGNPMYLVGISEDITERKRVEQEILTLNASLEERARELQATNQELESFSYSVSHDLRSPLRAIDGYALMLEEDYRDRLDDEGRRLLSVVRENSRRMGSLIDSLLGLSRLGRQQMNCVNVPMSAMVAEVVRELTEGRDSATVRFDIGALPAAHCDRALIRQVWVNLISNALKYSGRISEPVIAISARGDGGRAVYQVKDNGAGFDMQYAHKLFGVFQRLHRAEEFAGTGVGLAIVQRIVARHGGQVRAEGRPGAGATFEFSLAEGNTDE